MFIIKRFIKNNFDTIYIGSILRNVFPSLEIELTNAEANNYYVDVPTVIPDILFNVVYGHFGEHAPDNQDLYGS